MNIQLINGQFAASEALSILEQMIDVKIKFHENKISVLSTEEDIKMREKRIKELQNEKANLRTDLHLSNNKLSLSATVSLD